MSDTPKQPSDSTSNAQACSLDGMVRAHSPWQQKVLGWAARGCGIDARPSQMTKKQRRECEELVAEGLLRWAKNHSADKHGMFLRPNVRVSDGAPKDL